MEPTAIPLALTFDDVLLVPQASAVLPHEAVLDSLFARGLPLSAPIASAAMDTVTESSMAIAMALSGGIGVIHKNFPPERQAAEVGQVKAATGEFAPGATRDRQGRLACAAAVGVGADMNDRLAALERAGVDAVVVDTAHGHSANVLKTIETARKKYPGLRCVIGGNVATAAGTRALIDAGVDAVKVGIGPGSICTTRVVAGVGVPQLTAIFQCVEAARGTGVAIIADGGIKSSGDVVKALAAGASCVMMGSMLAGTDESPGELVRTDGGTFKAYRGMGSIGAMRAGSKDRYFQGGVEDVQKLVPEGVEGRVRYQGPVGSHLFQILGGLRSGMGYLGARTIRELRERASFVQITSAGLRESHVHDIAVAHEAPNYRLGGG